MGRSDTELFKDKIEVSLDGRQIFFLFFGGAVIASLVFVLGVMVGKRVEARAHVERSAATSAALDPLAALDQLGAEDRGDELTFPTALTGGETAADMPLGAVDAKLTRTLAEEKAARDRAAAEKTAAEKAAAEKTAAEKTAAEKTAAEKTAAEKAAAEKAAAEKAAAAKAAAEKAAAAKAAAERAAAEKAAAEKAAAARPAAAKPAAETAAADEDSDDDTDGADSESGENRTASKFTLQLSSFQDQAEAEAFHQRMIRAGYSPYITRAEVPDKGTWYRVRLGSYDSYSAAISAKKKFEAEQKIIAYVTRLKQ